MYLYKGGDRQKKGAGKERLETKDGREIPI